ncbi:uncharacterized protein F5Z01DRAFT_638811 [Emericellopsis atlantica]|uniref:NAD dependent epimerase/dehydratase n=1 Tax=Emericellopsis atlantica TaxID=2614577 RepID=A0A9P7ZHI7_9HYPO|nr:uncharacterized protein F5Z01DRAFT_638811 [Emericellopsis atlantica]KAG9251826.1 hypothetical protein F5Z01DRAFT_638811 [Emericellopsis atlantica]
MVQKLVPFSDGPLREKKVLSLGFYRTGSQSLKEALTILHYKDVFHSSAIMDAPAKFASLGAAADDNIACLPSYTGRHWNRAQWDRLFGPCEALTDVTPYSLDLLRAYPEAKVILVKRDFDSWATSYLNTLFLPSSAGIIPWLSGCVFEPMIGLKVSRIVWKFYMGLFGVCDLQKAGDRQIIRAGYNRHYDLIRSLVPPDRLLDIDLRDLSWEPLCKFLEKDVPVQPFPRLNESKTYAESWTLLHRWAFVGALVKIVPALLIVAGLTWWSKWYFAGNGRMI